MIHDATIARTQSPARALTGLVLVGSLLIFAAYAAALAWGHGAGLAAVWPGALANTIPTVALGIAVFCIVRDWLCDRSLAVQVVAHAALGPAYAITAYWILMVLLGALRGRSAIEFNVQPFPARESVWQILQNLTTYAVIAALAYGRQSGATTEPDTPGDRFRQDPPQSRYFIRTGDDILPIEVKSIVSISGADDYAEVVTVAGRHLARMTLAEFEKALDPATFIRVHRSHIVNAERIARAEPAGGGRLILHMQGGEAIRASRTGSRRIRDRVF